MFKKILKRLGIVLLLIAVVAGFRFVNGLEKEAIQYTQNTEKSIPNAELKQIKGSGVQKVLENQYLSVELNFKDGNVLITNKANGYVWSSCPTEEDIELDGSNDMWKNNLRSSVVFNYVNDTAQADANYGSVYSGKTDISVYEIDNGVRVFFDFVDNKIQLAYELRLKDDFLEVSVPADLISDSGIVYTKSKSGQKVIDKKNTFLLTEFTIFPYLGAVYGESNTKGYLFVPDGSGGLMDFSIDGNATGQFLGHVYGSDIALLSNYDNTIYSEMYSSKVQYPVYGMMRDENSFVAIIDEGETQADIIAAKKGVQTGFHSIQSKFKHRLKYKLVTNTTTGDGYFTYSEFNVGDTPKVLYHFDSGNEAGYVQMAKVYRDYLIDKNNINLEVAKEQSSALKLYVIFGDVEHSAVGDKFLTATTFDEAKEMVKYLKEQGLEELDVVCIGWQKNGLSTDYPERFGIRSSLGGESGLEELSKYVKDAGYGFYLGDDYTEMYSTKGVSLRKDTVYNIQDNSILGGRFANVTFSNEQMEKCAKKYEKFELDGIAEFSLGGVLASDFGKSHLLDRNGAKQAQLDQIARLTELYPSLTLWQPNAYLVRDNVAFRSFPNTNFHNIIDEIVPFYAIALHGLTTYEMGNYNNGFYEPTEQLLKAIEYGATVGFDVTAVPTSEMMFGYSFFDTSTEFKQWKDDIVTIGKRYEEFNAATAGKFIEDYQIVDKNVTKVVYEGDITVLINYSKADYSYEGTKIPACDFVIVK